MTDLSVRRPPPSRRAWGSCGGYVPRISCRRVMPQFPLLAAEFFAVVTDEKPPEAMGMVVHAVATTF